MRYGTGGSVRAGPIMFHPFCSAISASGHMWPCFRFQFNKMCLIFVHHEKKVCTNAVMLCCLIIWYFPHVAMGVCTMSLCSPDHLH